MTTPPAVRRVGASLMRKLMGRFGKVPTVSMPVVTQAAPQKIPVTHRELPVE